MDDLRDIKTPSLLEPRIIIKKKNKKEPKDKKKVKYLDQLYTKQFIRRYFDEK